MIRSCEILPKAKKMLIVFSFIAYWAAIRMNMIHESVSVLPIFSLAGLISMAMIRDAPITLHPMITARPTAPRPHTAQVEPASA